MDREAWQATVHGVIKSQTWLSGWACTVLTSRISESCGNSVWIMRNHQTVFHSSCTIWHSHQQCMWVPVSPHPHQHLSVFLMIDILASVKWLLLFSRSVMSDSLQPHGLQHARLPCPSPSPEIGSNSCTLSRWCHLIISSLSSPSPPAVNLSQHQGLSQWVGSLHQVAKVLELQLQQGKWLGYLFKKYQMSIPPASLFIPMNWSGGWAWASVLSLCAKLLVMSNSLQPWGL